ncbi:NUDIX domain-containing protein [Loktanella sp. DJP18]|uniref:NUDIX domain-containing protein n=1 Tax=Loktanella sp. DJP18 TaxID=3409788 RepID=UPI003BB61AAD
MGNTPYKLAVFLGRFQPFTRAHRDVVQNLCGKVDGTLMLTGSAYRPRSWKNPFSFNERKAFIEAGVADIDMRVDVLPLIDTLYNDRSWASNVRTAVRLYIRARGLLEETTEVVLTGFEKDASSRYLNWFPEWTMMPAQASRHEGEIINATDLRRALFFPTQDFGAVSERFGNKQVAQVVAWMKAHPTDTDTIQSEGLFVSAYRQKTREAEELFGFPIPINTADAVVIQSGHILLERRNIQPGKGTLALPGGHLAPSETSFHAVIRQLIQKTRLDMPKGALEGRLRDRKVFDHPERSERGWVRTEAFCFELQDRKTMEKIKGADEGSEASEGKAIWVPLSDITPDEMFEDHFDIIQHFVPDVSTSYTSILMAHVGNLQ